MVKMRSSTFTGNHIYAEIQKRKTEVSQIEVALKQMERKGTRYAPYQILEKQRNQIQEELDSILGLTYEVVHTPPSHDGYPSGWNMERPAKWEKKQDE